MSNAAEQFIGAFGKTVEAAKSLSDALEMAVPTSLPARIAALGTGQCCSESQYLDFDTTDKAAFDQSVKALRSTMSKAVARATARTGNTYITVTGDHRTRDGDIIVVATAVRTN